MAAEQQVWFAADNLAPQLRPWRTGAVVFSAAGLVALLVAVVGVYRSVSHTLSQRIHEIGIRMALGARGTHVCGLVLSEAFRLVAAGAVIGVIISLGAGHLIESMLYHTSARDPGVLATVSIALIAVAMLACVLPAWRATGVDPAIALRVE